MSDVADRTCPRSSSLNLRKPLNPDSASKFLSQMLDILRDAPLGQIIGYISRNRVLLYLEEKPDFELPMSYTAMITTDHSTRLPVSATPPPDEDGREQPINPNDVSGSPSPRPDYGLERTLTGAPIAKKVPSTPVIPTRSKDGTILVNWYTTDDPENPQMWTSSKKAFVAFQIWYPETLSVLICEVFIHSRYTSVPQYLPHRKRKNQSLT
jgi:hypothetical protein